MTLARTMIITLACIAGLGACSSEPPQPSKEPAGPAASPVAPPPSAQGKDVRSEVPPPPAPRAAEAAPSQASIYFDFDESLVKKDYQDDVIKHSHYLATNPVARVLLEGNADERGSREYNLALGNQRAEAVKRALLLLGIPEGRIETVTFGEEKPRMLGHDEMSWHENRRVDFVYKR